MEDWPVHCWVAILSRLERVVLALNGESKIEDV